MLESVYENSWEHQEAEWKQQKRKVLTAMGGLSGACVEIGKHISILIDKPTPALANLGPVETIYASKIIDYNNTFGRGPHKQNLVNVFSNMSNEFKDAVSGNSLHTNKF